MRKTFILLTILILIGLVLISCAPQTPTSTFEISPTQVTPSATREVAPVGSRSLVVFSYEEDGYAHLFVYDPIQESITRLTSNTWDDISPAVSPNGKKIAFASNRTGFWNIYILDLTSGEATQLTDTSDYEGAPSWSPDGAFLAYETYLNDNLEITIHSADDPTGDNVHLTVSPAADYSPTWAPGGRQIAYISDGDVILADLDKTGDARFINLSNTTDASESHPIWSPDGTKLAWASSAQSIGKSGIYIWDSTRSLPAIWLSEGDYPAWSPTGDQIITTLPAPNETFLMRYDLEGIPLQPLMPFPASLRGLTWADLILPDPLPEAYQDAAQLTPAPLWAAKADPITSGLATTRYSMVDLKDVQAPYPQLQDLADEAFDALRKRVIEKVGWDALASLENAFVPLTTVLDPGFEEDWLYTGRAFAINSLMTNAGWMVAVREDFGSQTYWRLYLRAQLQDGSLGEPLRDPPWDLGARYNLDPKIYEQGGTYSAVPPGYWVDVTSLALQYGWQRLPALPNWRTFYRGARFTEFALTDGLDFYSAMLQLYPSDVLVTPTRFLPPTATASRTPTFTPTATATRTPRNTLTPSATRTPSVTPTPSQTPLPSETPVTIVP